ncbi:MAG: porin family protein [Bdellovibrionota bacterium]
MKSSVSLIVGLSIFSALTLAGNAAARERSYKTIRTETSIEASRDSEDSDLSGDRIGVLFGTNLSSAHHAYDSIEGKSKLSLPEHGKFSAAFGASYETSIYINHVFLQPEVHYLRRELVLRNFDVPSRVSEHASVSMHYLQFPLLVKGKLYASDFEFSAFTGPFLGYVVSSRTDTVRINFNNRSEDSQMTAGKNALHKLDYGIVAGLGTGYRFTKTITGVLNARLNYGMRSLLKPTQLDYRSSDIAFHAGVQFTI